MLVTFDSFELDILEAAFEVVKNRENTLVNLDIDKSKGLGIEGWFLIELLANPKFKKWGINKIQSPADLKVREKIVELKGVSVNNFYYVRNWWKKHPNNADIILFLSIFNDKIKEQIDKVFNQGYEIKTKQVNKNWIIGIFKI